MIPSKPIAIQTSRNSTPVVFILLENSSTSFETFERIHRQVALVKQFRSAKEPRMRGHLSVPLTLTVQCGHALRLQMDLALIFA